MFTCVLVHAHVFEGGLLIGASVTKSFGVHARVCMCS